MIAHCSQHRASHADLGICIIHMYLVVHLTIETISTCSNIACVYAGVLETMWILVRVQVHSQDTISMTLFVMNDTPINVPGENSTYPVLAGFHLATGTKVVAKFLDYTSADERQYAHEEASFNELIKQYEWMNVAQLLDHFARNDEYVLVFRTVDGVLLTEHLIATTSTAQRFFWLIDVATSLSFCHLHGVFHCDVADWGYNKTINVMIQHNNRICLIDFGDSVYPRCNVDTQEALHVDLKKLENLAHRLFPGLDDVAFAVEFPKQRLTVKECRLWIYNQLWHPEFQLPAGFGGAMAVLQSM